MSSIGASDKQKMIEDKKNHFAQFVTNDSLNLRLQGLSDEDMPALIHFLIDYPAITTLDLSHNNIGNQGIADFAERNLTVTCVNFTGNNIGDNGVAVFAYKNHVVKQVNFSHNLISSKGIASFSQINQTCYTSQFSTIQFH